MAAPMSCSCCRILIKSTKIHINSIKYSRLKYANTMAKSRLCSTLSEQPAKHEETLFIRPDVQNILAKITGFHLEKIFRFRQLTDVETPKYKLLTDKQLQEHNEEAFNRGRERLQMPPVKKAWNIDHADIKILSSDCEIANFELNGCPYVFTDVTYGIPHRDRVVAVREIDGTLRLADNEERNRVLQVYFPQPGKMYQMPKMFEEENLEKVLGEQRYEYVLDRACVQFEPDDPKYITVTRRTYEHIESRQRFDDLRSTRHFGPMAFYFAFYKKVDELLIDMLQRNLLEDAESLVKLYHILHPECESANETLQKKITDSYELIQTFAKYDALKCGPVELALESQQMQQQQRSQQTLP